MALPEAYQSISCINHERLELAVLKRQWLEIEVLQGACMGRQRLLPIDVYAREGSEWLVAELASGERITLRLDWLKF